MRMFFGFCSRVFEVARRLSALSVTRRIFVFSAASCGPLLRPLRLFGFDFFDLFLIKPNFLNFFDQ